MLLKASLTSAALPKIQHHHGCNSGAVIEEVAVEDVEDEEDEEEEDRGVGGTSGKAPSVPPVSTSTATTMCRNPASSQFGRRRISSRQTF